MPEDKPPEPSKPGETPADQAGAAQKPDAREAEAKPLPHAQPLQEAAAAGKTQTSEKEIAAPSQRAPEVPPPAAPPAAKPAEVKAHEKPAAAAPAGPVGQPWSGDIASALAKTFPEIAIQAFTYLGQNYLILPRESVLPIAMFLKTDLQFQLLSDLTAVDYPTRENRFEVIYQLYSFDRNERLRLKVPLGEQETIESVTPVWSGADWMEREVYDMFGIRFDHHPNLRRILLPEEWEGYPLRKDYSILQQDVRWVQENLHIESGQ